MLVENLVVALAVWGQAFVGVTILWGVAGTETVGHKAPKLYLAQGASKIRVRPFNLPLDKTCRIAGGDSAVHGDGGV